MPKRIGSLEELKKAAQNEQDSEFFILLRGYHRSSKRIFWDEGKRHFSILNCIDNTKQVLTESQLMDREYTNIGYALTNGALFKDD
jgi:hypothetical protein